MVKFLCRTRRFSRLSRRPSAHRITRRPHHSCLRRFAGYRRPPDDLGHALTALTRAIRSHRKLAKLAPHLFDATEMNRIEQRKKEDAEWRAMWEPALETVYGPSTEKWPEPTYHMPLSPQTLRAVDRHYARWRFWMDIGSQALVRFERRQPYALPSMSRIARLLDIGFTLAHLACGEPARPDPAPHAQALAGSRTRLWSTSAGRRNLFNPGPETQTRTRAWNQICPSPSEQRRVNGSVFPYGHRPHNSRSHRYQTRPIALPVRHRAAWTLVFGANRTGGWNNIEMLTKCPFLLIRGACVGERQF